MATITIKSTNPFNGEVETLESEIPDDRVYDFMEMFRKFKAKAKTSTKVIVQDLTQTPKNKFTDKKPINMEEAYNWLKMKKINEMIRGSV